MFGSLIFSSRGLSGNTAPLSLSSNPGLSRSEVTLAWRLQEERKAKADRGTMEMTTRSYPRLNTGDLVITMICEELQSINATRTKKALSSRYWSLLLLASGSFPFALLDRIVFSSG